MNTLWSNCRNTMPTHVIHIVTGIMRDRRKMLCIIGTLALIVLILIVVLIVLVVIFTKHGLLHVLFTKPSKPLLSSSNYKFQLKKKTNNNYLLTYPIRNYFHA